MAAVAAELKVRRVEGAARRADPIQFGTTLPAELLSFRVFGLALRTFHRTIPP